MDNIEAGGLHPRLQIQYYDARGANHREEGKYVSSLKYFCQALEKAEEYKKMLEDGEEPGNLDTEDREEAVERIETYEHLLEDQIRRLEDELDILENT